MLTAAAIVAVAAALVVVLGQVSVARHRAAAAAETAAWAASIEAMTGPAPACALARVVAARAGASVLSCRLTPTRVVVVAGVNLRLAAVRAEGSWPRRAG